MNEVAAGPISQTDNTLQIMGEAVPGYLWVCKAGGEPVYVNRRWVEFSGLSIDPGDSIPMNVLHHPDDYPGIVETWKKSSAEGLAFDSEYRIRRHDGVYRWVMTRVVPVKDEGGAVVQWVGTTTDIHERKLAEQALDSIEDRFQATFEQAAVGIAHMTQEGMWLRANQRLCDIVGYSREELFAIGFREITHPDDYEIDFPQLRQMLEGELQRYSIEKRYIRKDGELIWVNVSASLAFDRKGAPDYFIAVIEDITERKQAEQELTKSLRILSSAEHVAQLGSWEWDLRTNTMSLSRGLWRITGANQDTQGDSFPELLELVHEDDQLRVRTEIESAAREGHSFVCKYRIVRPNGGVRVLSVRGEPIQNERGETERLIGSAQDITDIEEADSALAKRSRMSAMITDVGVALTDDTPLAISLQRCADTALWYLGAASVRVWITEGSENALKLYTSAGDETSAEGASSRIRSSHKHIDRVASTRSAYYTNSVREDPLIEDSAWAERESIVAFVGHPLIVGERLLGVLSVFLRRELTPVSLETLASVADVMAVGIQRRRAEDDLRALNVQLEHIVADRTAELAATVKELDAFSYSVSHDLRAPLRSIDGFSRALLQDYGQDLPEQAQHYLNRVRSNAQQMGTLIDSLLAFAQLGRQPLKRQPVVICDIVTEVIAELRRDNSGLNVEVLIEDLPVCECDPVLIRQVFTNLLSNAFKYSSRCENPMVEVGVLSEDRHEGCDSDDKQGVQTFYVKDNGVGFDMQYAHKLFAVFQRLHRAEDFAGTGVGLALVQRIVNRHGGRIWAESQVGAGATFHFTLQGETHDQ